MKRRGETPRRTFGRQAPRSSACGAFSSIPNGGIKALLVMRRVILESPYAGDVDRNVRYARACVRDSVLRGEAPIASHLLFTQIGILRDDEPVERRLGQEAGLAWLGKADATVVYTDLGISPGMRDGIRRAEQLGIHVEYRTLTTEQLQTADIDPSGKAPP